MDPAFLRLEKGIEQRSSGVAYLQFDGNFPADMRASPCFQNILRRMNFPQMPVLLIPALLISTPTCHGSKNGINVRPPCTPGSSPNIV
jgi:hypothetical protein